MHKRYHGSVFAGAVLLLASLCGQAAGQELLPDPELMFTLPGSEHVLADSSAFRPSFSPVASSRPAWHDAVTLLPGDWLTAGSTIFRPASLPAIAGIAMVTGALIVSDHETHRASIRLARRSPFVQGASELFVHLGEGSTHLGMAAAFGLYGFLADDSRALRTASQTVEALLATGITVQFLKRIAGRESPAMASRERGRWRPFPNLSQYQKNQPKYYAFPSGHISTAMATLTVIAENYPEQRWIRPVGYVLLAGLGVGLVNVHYHWFSDLPLGIALGYLFGKIAAQRPVEGLTGGAVSHEPQMILLPTLQEEGAGVTLALLF